MIGLNETNDKILCLACEGIPATRTGHVLEEAAGKLLIARARNALLIDEGDDAFQKVLLGLNGPKARVAGGGPELDVTVPFAPTRLPGTPLKRTRMRATFIFARRRIQPAAAVGR